MKAKYIMPSVEVMQVEAYALMQSISGPAGMMDGGQATPGVKPQSPGRPIY